MGAEVTLGDYLAAAGRKPWRDGEHDCATFPADWAVLCGRPDPMARWRGAYADAAGAEALIADAGGLAPLWTLGCADAGIPEAEGSQEGDIGIITMLGEGGFVESGAIFTGKRWAFLAPRGLYASTIDPVHILKVWRPCPAS